MRLPAYYCPHCKRFKRFYQITNGDYDFGNCKHCGTEAVCTDSVILDLIAENIEKHESIKRAARAIDFVTRRDVIQEIIDKASENIAQMTSKGEL